MLKDSRSVAEDYFRAIAVAPEREQYFRASAVAPEGEEYFRVRVGLGLGNWKFGNGKIVN